MYSKLSTPALLAGLLATVNAHTSVGKWIVGGKEYAGYRDEGIKDPGNGSPAWWTNQGWGWQPVMGADMNTADIIAHKDAQPSPHCAEAAAGSTVQVVWDHEWNGECVKRGGQEEGWDCSHHGPTLTYLAPVEGEFSAIKKEDLKFFKIDERGLVGPSDGKYGDPNAGETGKWATDEIFYDNDPEATGGKYNFTIPANIPSGKYVLRTEVASLHDGSQGVDKVQFWPQAFNIEVTGGDDSAQVPEGVVGTELYSPSDAMWNWNIYAKNDLNSPPACAGPALMSSGGSSGTTPSKPASSAAAPSGSAAASSAVPSKTADAAVPSQTSEAAVPDYVAPTQSAIPIYEPPTESAAPGYEAPTESSTPTYQAPSESTTPTYDAPAESTAPTYQASPVESPAEETQPEQEYGQQYGAPSEVETEAATETETETEEATPAAETPAAETPCPTGEGKAEVTPAAQPQPEDMPAAGDYSGHSRHHPRDFAAY